MIRFYSVEEKQAIDKLAEEKFGIPPIVLMENAATNISNSIIKCHYHYEYRDKDYHFAIFCGIGNNGGDGMAIARHLLSEGFKVKVWIVGDLSKMTAATRTNMEILQRINPALVQVLRDTDGIIEIIEELKIHNRNVIIDAIYGIGFRGDVIKDSLVRDLLIILNEYHFSKQLRDEVFTISIDVPSGFDASTGKNAKEVFQADTVYSIGGENFFSYKGNTYNRVVSLGYGGGIECNNMRLESNDERRFPSRKYNSNAHKYDFGKVVVIAGSKDMPGAAALCSNAAIKTGAGIVELLTPKIHDSLLPEIISPELETKNGCFDLSHFDFINEKIQRADAVALGPGITKNEETMALVRKLVFSNLEKRWVIDGDAIGAFNADDVFSPSVVFTPHLGEFKRLTGNKELLEHNIELYNFLKATAKQMNCVFLLKGNETMITDGVKTYFNSEGNSNMATAGSGDVLTGIIAANLAQYRQDLPDKDIYGCKIDFDITENVAISSLVHVNAAEWAMGIYRERLFTASDIINGIQHTQEV